MLPHAALVPVPAAGVSSPGGVALYAGAGEGSHCVGTDRVTAAVVWKVPVSTLIDLDTALVRCVITVAQITVTSPAPDSVDTGCQSPAVRGRGGVHRALINIRTTLIIH